MSKTEKPKESRHFLIECSECGWRNPVRGPLVPVLGAHNCAKYHNRQRHPDGSLVYKFPHHWTRKDIIDSLKEQEEQTQRLVKEREQERGELGQLRWQMARLREMFTPLNAIVAIGNGAVKP